MDPSAGVDRGRIWRIVPEGFKRPAPPRLGKRTAELVALLEHPNGWHRDTAARLLYQRQPLGRPVRRRLEELARKGKTPPARVHALHALAPLAGTNDKLLKARRWPTPTRGSASTPCGCARTPGRTTKRELSDADVGNCAATPDPNVRIQLAYSMPASRRPRPTGRTSTGEAAVFVQLALKDVADPWMRLAVLAGMKPEHTGPVASELAKSQYFRGQKDGPAFIQAVTEVAAAEPNGDQRQTLFQLVRT